MTMFERCAPAIAVFLVGVAVMAAIFGAVALLGGSPVTPEVYGPKVYEVPALAWAGTQLGISLFGLWAILRGRDGLAALAIFALLALFMTFATMAIQAGATGTVLIGMAVGSSVMCAVYGWWAWRSHRGRG